MNRSFQIIPSVKELKNLSYALSLNNDYIYLSDVHIGNLKSLTERCHKEKKQVIVNLDLISGLNPDPVGIKLLKQLFKVDLVIARGVTKVNIAKSSGLRVIQRIILEDTIAVENSIKHLKDSKANMIELRPGFYGMRFANRLREVKDLPIIISGFVDSEDMLQEANRIGVFGVTTSSKDLWGSKIDS